MLFRSGNRVLRPPVQSGSCVSKTQNRLALMSLPKRRSCEPRRSEHNLAARDLRRFCPLNRRRRIQKQPAQNPAGVHSRRDVERQIPITAGPLEHISDHHRRDRAPQVPPRVHRSGNGPRVFSAKIHRRRPSVRHREIAEEARHGDRHYSPDGIRHQRGTKRGLRATFTTQSWERALQRGELLSLIPLAVADQTNQPTTPHRVDRRPGKPMPWPRHRRFAQCPKRQAQTIPETNPENPGPKRNNQFGCEFDLL